MEEADIVVIGAGWYGLAAAKTFIELNPEVDLIVLDGSPTVGGVWSEHRLYPGLKSNNMKGKLEYSDFPMDEATYRVKHGEHVPGPVLHQYLTAYSKKFDVHRRIRFNTWAQTVERIESGGWLITTTSNVSGAPEESQIRTKKLVVATGLTSGPFMPAFIGAESFNAPLFHTKDFAKNADTIQSARSVTVFGGTKSAWDAAYEYAAAGVPVNMVIRESGHGPVWMAPAYVTPFKIWLEKLVFTRLLTWFSPCVWGDADGYPRIRRFLHGTAVGRWIVDTFWGILNNDVIQLNGYDEHPETKKLKPWYGSFWIGGGLSITNHGGDFFEMVRRGKIKVYIADMIRLSERTVHLSTGEALKSDALICATGWKHLPPIKFLPEGIDADLGLPHYTSQPDPIFRKADAEILARYPRLKAQPPGNPHFKPLPRDEDDASAPDATNEPWRLHRFMVPPAYIHDRSIAFAGMLIVICTCISAQTQALWIAAYFANELDITASDADIKWEMALHTQFGKWRYPCGYGARYPDFVFDAMPYLDMVLGDLGLRKWRKKGRLAEIVEPYGPEDYKGLIDEWKALRKKAQ